MIRIISNRNVCAPVLAPLAVLFLSSCGGGSTATDAAPASVSGTSPTVSELPPCGIEGSGHAIPFSSCTPGGVQLGTMATPRAGHTATLLPDGRVLIAGGFGDGFAALASAELYDPSTGTFSPTGDMTTTRGGHTATLIANSKVLIAGGVTDARTRTTLGSAEIYDPSTGTFATTGNMISGSNWSRSVLLPDGRIFIAADGNGEIYEPATGTFVLTGAYSSPTLQVDTAALLPDGRVLVVGCAAQCSVGTTELFDPKSGTFSPTGARVAWSSISTATLLTSGTVLLLEGNDSALPDDAEIYDPASGTFAHIGYTHDIHEFSTATRLPDGTVLIAGGQLAGGNGSPAVELYVPATATFALAASLTTGRQEHTATLLHDGTVLIAGGYTFWPNPTASAEIYK
jgi:WD40 repeat protein